MNQSERADVIYSSLDIMCIRPGPKTAKARRPWKISKDQMTDWDSFFTDVRSFAAHHLGAPSAQTALLPATKRYIVAAEGGVAGSIQENALNKVGDVLAAEGLSVSFGDRSTGLHMITDFYPDTIAQPSLDHGQTRLVGQVAKYMDEYGCKYGFICTYKQAIFMKRQSMFRFLLSPVIYGTQASTANALSMRECLYYFARISGTADWKYHGQKGGAALVSAQSN
ncbi:hypothetical protein APSETT444_003985 [Aspergillus pseudonomiae]